MNFFTRAIKNVTRKISKSILLIITFFLIGNLVIIGLGVSSATENAKILTRQKMRAVATLELDYNAIDSYVSQLEDKDEINEFYQNYPQITFADVNALIGDKRVSTANVLNTEMWYDAEGIEFVRLGNEAEENMDQEECWVTMTGEERCYTYYTPKYCVKANMYPNMIEVLDGEYTITEGRFYSQEEIDNNENVVLITNALAEVNNIKVGDKISFLCREPSIFEYEELEGLDPDLAVVEFEVIGLYDCATKLNPGSSSYQYLQPYENPDNTLLMPSTACYAVGLPIQQAIFDYYCEQYPDDDYYKPENRPTYDSIRDQYISDATFFLSDPLDVDGFVEDYQDNLGQFIKLNANNDEFNRLSKPLNTLNLYANFIIWLVVINAIVIITLVTALTLKTREYEIGVLLSIGASKLKIIAQFFVELALVAVIGFSLSIVSGTLISGKVGEVVLEYQLQEEELKEEDDYYYDDDYYNIWDTDYTTKVTLDDLISEYHVSISPIIIIEIYVLGLAIVFISIIIPSLMIMRFNPKRILMNQN